jgi:hypothetical protein
MYSQLPSITGGQPFIRYLRKRHAIVTREKNGTKEEINNKSVISELPIGQMSIVFILMMKFL